MAAEAYPVGVTTAWERGRIVLSAAVEPGDVLQHHDGRACVVESTKDLAIGDEAGVLLSGQIEVPFAADVAAVRGAPVWWDKSANVAVAVPGLSVGDFYLGICDEDKDGVATTGMRAKVRINERPAYAWSLKDGGQGGAGDEIVETNGLGVRVLSGGSVRLAFDAVSEAATAYLLSGEALPTADNFLFHAIVNVVANGDAAAFDAVIGIANEGHATDPDLIAESCFVSINGGSDDLNAESDDGTTEVAATDTTVNFTAGTPFAVWIDKRDNADVKIYIDGIRRLSGSTFVLTAATGPLKALVMAEKTANATAAEIVVLQMGLVRSDDAS